MNNSKIIFGIHVKERLKDASQIQSLFTKYGCNIKTRLGLHDVDKNVCSGSGIVLLELIGELTDINNFEKDLLEVPGVIVKKMIF